MTKFERLVKQEIKPYRPTLFDLLHQQKSVKIPKYILETDMSYHYTKASAIEQLRKLIKG